MNLYETFAALFALYFVVSFIFALVFVALTIKHVRRKNSTSATVYGALAAFALANALPGLVPLLADLSRR